MSPCRSSKRHLAPRSEKGTGTLSEPRKGSSTHVLWALCSVYVGCAASLLPAPRRALLRWPRRAAPHIPCARHCPRAWRQPQHERPRRTRCRPEGNGAIVTPARCALPSALSHALPPWRGVPYLAKLRHLGLDVAAVLVGGHGKPNGLGRAVVNHAKDAQ